MQTISRNPVLMYAPELVKRGQTFPAWLFMMTFLPPSARLKSS